MTEHPAAGPGVGEQGHEAPRRSVIADAARSMSAEAVAALDDYVLEHGPLEIVREGDSLRFSVKQNVRIRPKTDDERIREAIADRDREWVTAWRLISARPFAFDDPIGSGVDFYDLACDLLAKDGPDEFLAWAASLGGEG